MENILGIDSNLESTEPSVVDTPDLNTQESTAPLITDYADPVANPQVPLSSSRGKEDPFMSSINQANNNLYNQRQQDQFTGTSYYNPETKERYRNDPSIYNSYFDPKGDNEKIAYQNWDMMDALSTGWNGFKDSYASSFGEYFRYDRIGKALFNLDADYLEPDESDLDRMAYKQHQNELKNPIFYAPGTETDFLTKGFLAESLANLGFTFGTISGVFAEQAAFKALEAGLAFIAPETGGASLAAAGELEVAGDAHAAWGLGKVWKGLTNLFTGTALGNVEHLSQAGKLTSNVMREGKALEGVAQTARTVAQEQNVVSNGLKYGTGFWDNALKLASKIPFGGEIADAARIYRAGKGILTTRELFQLGIGGFRRSLGEWQLAASEAAIEAGGNYKDTLDQLLDEYKISHGGNDPIGDDYVNLKNIAMRSSTVDFGTNVAILGVMNKIQWGSLFGKFSAESAAISQIRLRLAKEADELGITVVRGIGKETGKMTTRGYQKGFLRTIGLLPKIAEDFGRKQAAWELGKSTLKGITKIQLSEGIQENLQDITTAATRDYYVSMYKNDPTTWGQNFDEALSSQFSKQGLKTFLSGALTGLFIGPAMHVVQHTISSFDKQAQQHKESVKESLEHINNFFKGDHERVLKESIKQIKIQNDLNNNKLEAISARDKYQWHNNQDSSLIQTILHAKRTGTLDNLVSFIKGYSNLSNEEFKSAFSFSPEELGSGSSSDVMNALGNSVKTYSEIYDRYMTKYGLYLGLDAYMKDGLDKQKFTVKKAAMLDAIATISFLEAKGQSSLNRQAGIREKLGNYKSIGNSLSTAFGTMVDFEKMQNGMLILENEIAGLKDSLKVEGLSDSEKDQTLKLIDAKEKEKIHLGMMSGLIFQKRTIPDPADPTKTVEFYDANPIIKSNEVLRNLMAEQITEYLQLKNKQAGINNKVSVDEINDAIDDIIDYMSLGRDHQEYVDAVNLLNDPKNFGRYQERLQDARVSAHARLLYDELQKLGEISEVGRKFVDDNDDLLKQLLEFSQSGAGTFENMKELDRIRRQIFEKKDELEQQAEEQAEKTKEETEKKKKEQEEKVKNSRTSRELKPLISMYMEATTNDDEELKKAIDEYMAMRYSLEELEQFPFDETDPTKRVVTRYYVDENGNKIMFGNDEYGKIKVPEMSGEEPINDLGSLYAYLYNVEEYLYDQSQQATTATPAQADTTTEKIDDEKKRLANFVGQPVMLNGEKGILEVVTWKNDDKAKSYVVTFPDGDVVKLTEINDEDNHSFDDFTELSIAYESVEAETKSEVSSSPNPVVDTNVEGTVTIKLDDNLESVEINGVKWTIEKDDDGLITAFSRIETRPGKGKKKRAKDVIVRLSVNNPKGAEYAARVNALITLAMPEVPTTVEEITNEMEVLDSAIVEAQKAVFEEKAASERSEDVLTENRLRKIKDEDIPDDILEIKTKFDNPSTRGTVTEDELIKLFMWADDLLKKINKEFKSKLDLPTVSNTISELNKDYINPINDIINGRGRKENKGSRKATDRTPTQEKSTQKLVEKLKPKEAEPDTKKGKRKSKKQERGNLKSAVESTKQAELEFPTPEIGKQESEDSIQELPVDSGITRINNIDTNMFSEITSAITESGAAPVSTINKKAEIEKQKELENKVKELEEQRKALRSKDGSISADKMSDFKRLGLEINEAKRAALRGNNTIPIFIKRFLEGVDKATTDPELLSTKDREEAIDIIEQVIQNSKTADEALRKIQRLGYIFAINDIQILKKYLEDRFDSNAPRIGNNKDSFQAWIYGKTDAELTTSEGTTKTETTSPFAELINKISCDI